MSKKRWRKMDFRTRFACRAEGRLLYPWLSAHDEANILGYYVPTPEEIEAQVSVLRKRKQDQPRPELPNEAVFVPMRRHAFD